MPEPLLGPAVAGEGMQNTLGFPPDLKGQHGTGEITARLPCRARAACSVNILRTMQT